jgi:hypothetical protein
LWSLYASSSDYESFEVSSQPIQPVVEKVVTLMQSSTNLDLLLESVESTNVVAPIESSADPTPLLGGDVPIDHVVLQPIHPVVEKVFTPMQTSVDPTLLLESVESTKVVTPMQSSTDPTLRLGSDVSTNYVFSISSSVLSEQGAFRSLRANPLQALGRFPLIGMTLLSLAFLLLHLFK